jgi:hypothetical protein
LFTKQLGIFFQVQCMTHKGDLPFVASVFRFPANPLKLEGKPIWISVKIGFWQIGMSCD